MAKSNAPSRKPVVLLSIAGLIAAGVAGALFWPSSPAPPKSPPATKVEDLPGPKFARFDIPNDKVKVRVVGQGFEVINTDSSLTGTQVDFAGVTVDGQRIPYSVKLPPPVPNPAEP